MLSRYSAEQISRALFETDPMNTGCKENDCFDEYDRVAIDIADRLAAGESIEEALSTEILDWFFDGGQCDKSLLQQVLERLGEEGQ